MRASLYTVRGLPHGNVSLMARPRGGDWLCDEIKALHHAGVDILVSLLTDMEVRELDLTEEAAFCQQQGSTYLSLAITDQSVPRLLSRHLCCSSWVLDMPQRKQYFFSHGKAMLGIIFAIIFVGGILTGIHSLYPATVKPGGRMD